MSEGSRPWVFGEVLFDRFPGGSQVLGGAPFNVAWHLQAFGQRPLFISRVGDDEDGRRIRAAMEQWGLDVAGLQTDSELPTGGVCVRFEGEEPVYEIEHPVAYDAIEPPGLPGRPALLYHGSLALRSAASRRALDSLLAQRPETVFVDVNLRSPWWARDQVVARLESADWVKLNGAELQQLAGDRGRPDPKAFMQSHGLSGLVLTHGARGAELHLRGEGCFSVEPGPGGTMVDAVGAGDALAAVVICGLLEGWPPQTALRRAQEFASGICGRRGATVREQAFYASVVEQWPERGG